ncbi:MAG: hypothetical protein QOC98_1604, partial [Frankiaceae bacterium]|nr:hypothetical protein [Frankiaceae bacterium]
LLAQASARRRAKQAKRDQHKPKTGSPQRTADWNNPPEGADTDPDLPF